MKNTYKFTFPFTGQVKTQLIISKNRLVKPKNVKKFENAVRSCLAVAFPLELRPIEGYLRFDMIHYTQYKRDSEGAILPKKHYGDNDNIFKTLADCFEPIYKKMVLFDEDGNPLLTDKGNKRYEKVLVTPGVIKNDKYIFRANLNWVPVETEEEERIEVYITPLSEEELFLPPVFENVSEL
jgi:Holliday junction resolvase RusA-like endonuclease